MPRKSSEAASTAERVEVLLLLLLPSSKFSLPLSPPSSSSSSSLFSFPLLLFPLLFSSATPLAAAERAALNVRASGLTPALSIADELRLSRPPRKLDEEEEEEELKAFDDDDEEPASSPSFPEKKAPPPPGPRVRVHQRVERHEVRAQACGGHLVDERERERERALAAAALAVEVVFSAAAKAEAENLDALFFLFLSLFSTAASLHRLPLPGSGGHVDKRRPRVDVGLDPAGPHLVEEGQGAREVG
jgi:hypothetical protein